MPKQKRQMPEGFTGNVPGGIIGVVHGARSPLIVSDLAADVFEDLREHIPWILDCDLLAVDQMCTATVQHRLLNDYAMAVLEGRREVPARPGRPRTGYEALPQNIWRDLSTSLNIAMRAVDRLGLSPEGRGKVTSALGLAVHYAREQRDSLVQEGESLREQRLRVLGPPEEAGG